MMTIPLIALRSLDGNRSAERAKERAGEKAKARARTKTWDNEEVAKLGVKARMEVSVDAVRTKDEERAKAKARSNWFESLKACDKALSCESSPQHRNSVSTVHHKYSTIKY